ncbi:bifunctional transcriptional activator/DNA repair enzyme AdaA [Jannaschia ovalis]|uniref:Trifunctional transcriptional activator/DNA repair protein Ada/methylated-DNA--[protein]-cysteine S-methyltransferase n=1 Tax=Jannaschia ovalis TaxID=3038773 RepID=A0ABY8LDN9_9RHOB|nr:trifunctional transcriptional activator/DNA repair protein Ada/methylated-DNA--[protein]-cysteine S-methyltransferase [Jannaschia sp. GRR-S6-38]WGH79436.1 trifunctional transcriptional activator/DNA repair protein Ada/methylated-DNA--[protein]-cysteine S-methyltransferase [Jannaschia sp. GRR-S6-38]
MLFALPSDDTLYDALLARDPAWDGRAWVAVGSTGVFCRLTCPARKPRRENCTFHASIAACLEAGFRPCKRCHPLAGGTDPATADLLAALEADPGRRWTEACVAARGWDPSTIRRAFRRQFGMTFLTMARLRRLGRGAAELAEGGAVIAAQQAAGFESASGFRCAFARYLGVAPGTLARDGLLQADWIETALGAMVAVASRTHLHLLEFADRPALPNELRRLRAEAKGSLGLGRLPPVDAVAAELDAFLAGRGAGFATPLEPAGTPFQRQVWAALRAIPPGHTRSYSEIAAAIGRPAATRAVARANGANRIAVVIPCHRVIGADGSLTGYGGGLWRKRRLIEAERAYR